ncbi:Cell division control protein 7 [Dimargaris cristalligena]|nr:Cell division control protein 7 [Dimargaris cristalligena]
MSCLNPSESEAAMPYSGPARSNSTPHLSSQLPSEETSEADSEEEAVCDEVLKEMEDLEQNFPAVAKQYRLISKIGEGTFSCVYKAVDVNYSKYDNRYWDVAPTPADDRPVLHQSKRTKVTNDPCSHQPPSREPRKYVAVKKIYVTSSPARIANEIQILKDLTGHPHVGPLITALRHEDQVLVVLPYFQHHDFRDYYRTMNLEQIKRYLYCLFSALEYTHRHKILHRDVKPSNFLFNIDTQHGVLVDFGLAQYMEHPVEPPTGLKTPQRPTSTGSNSLANRPTSAQNWSASVLTSQALNGLSATIPAPGPDIDRSTYSTITPFPLPNPLKTPTPMRYESVTGPTQNYDASSTTSTPQVSRTQPTAETSEPSYRQRLKESSLRFYHPQKTPQSTQPSPAVRGSTMNTAGARGGQAEPTQPATPLNHKSKKVVPHTHSLGASTSLYPRRPAVEQTPTIVDSRQRPGILRRDLRPSVRANRAGTRGFRAPEVLLKVTYQTQAIDIWSVGVIMLSILTHRFPFFNSTDDQEALLEMGVLFGKKEMERVASLHDRAFFTNVPTVRESAIPFDRLVKVYNSGGLAVFPPEVYDLLTQCFALDPNERITAQEALQHPLFH